MTYSDVGVVEKLVVESTPEVYELDFGHLCLFIQLNVHPHSFPL